MRRQQTEQQQRVTGAARDYDGNFLRDGVTPGHADVVGVNVGVNVGVGEGGVFNGGGVG